MIIKVTVQITWLLT